MTDLRRLSDAEIPSLAEFDCPSRRRWQRDARRIIRSIEFAIDEGRPIAVYGHHDDVSFVSVAAVEPMELGWNLIVLGVTEGHDGHGLAGELLEYAVAACFAADPTVVFWEVHRLNQEMLHVCQKLGLVGEPDPDDSEFILFQVEPTA